MLQGAIMPMQQCQFNDAPKGEGHFTYAAMLENNRLSPRFQGPYDVRSNAMQGTPRLLQGVNAITQKCQPSVTPTSFIWCREIIAAMPIQKRTKGRVKRDQQRCHSEGALPTQFNGVIVKTQKCLDIVAPRGEPSKVRRDASIGALSPTSLTGTLT